MRRQGSHRLVGWVFVVVATPAWGQSATVLPAPADVDRIVAAQMKADGAVGLALAVIQDAKLTYVKGFGAANREANTPVTPETLFRWASVSKSVTAVAAMQLVEQGKIDLAANVRTYVPEFPDWGVKITPRDLLCHQSGIVHYTNGRVVKTQRSYDEPHPFRHVIYALDTFRESPLLHRPGEKYSYTTHGYILLSAVVERAGGAPFWEQVRRRIVEPLGLGSFRPDYQWESIPGRATGYRRVRGEVLPSTDTDVSWKLGGGGFLSNVGDMAKFAIGLLEGRLVRPETATLMWTPQKLADGTATRYGLGFAITGPPDQPRIGHSGAQEKTRTLMTFDPKKRWGIVVMTNSEYVRPAVYAQALLGERPPAATHAATKKATTKKGPSTNGISKKAPAKKLEAKTAVLKRAVDS